MAIDGVGVLSDLPGSAKQGEWRGSRSKRLQTLSANKPPLIILIVHTKCDVLGGESERMILGKRWLQPAVYED